MNKPPKVTKYLAWLSALLVNSLHAGVDPELIFNSGFEFDEGCSVFTGIGDTIAFRSITVTGDFLLNGAPFPAVEYNDANFSLRDRLTNNVFDIGNSHDLSYSIDLVPGVYDVLYSLESNQDDEVPRNEGAVIMENVPLLADQTLDIDVAAYTLAGDFLLNGGEFPAAENDDARFYLVSEQMGQLELGDSKLQGFADVMVLPGDYAVFYQVESELTVPRNTWAKVALLSVSADNNAVVIDVPSVTINGNFLHNGVAPPIFANDDGNFYLETGDGDRVFLGNSTAGSYSRTIIPGKYEAWFEVDSNGATMPVNERARIASNLNAVGGTLDISMLTNVVSGSFTHNGLAFPNVMQQTGQILLRDKDTGVETQLALTMDGGYSDRIIRGTYDLVYKHIEGNDVPLNQNRVLVANKNIKIDETIDLDVESSLYFADVHHNGALFPADAANFGNIWFRDTASDDKALLGKTSLQSFAARLVPATYDAYYAHIIGSDVPGNQMALFAENIVIDPVVEPPAGGGNVLSVESWLFSGNIVMNDAPPPASEFDDGIISLKWDEDAVELGNTHDGSYASARVVIYRNPAYYWAHYAVQSVDTTPPTDGDIPWNGDSRLSCINLDPIAF